MNLRIYLFVLIGLVLSQVSWAQTSSVIIDVRTPSEFQESHLKGAMNIDVQSSEFKAQIQKLDPKQSYVVYCRSGARSAKAVDIMSKIGFKNARSVGSLSEAAKAMKLPCEGKVAKC